MLILLLFKCHCNLLQGCFNVVRDEGAVIKQICEWNVPLTKSVFDCVVFSALMHILHIKQPHIALFLSLNPGADKKPLIR